MNIAVDELPRAHGEAPLRGRLRASPEDFRVEELAAFEADGQGEHVLLDVEKRGENTEWVARELARYCQIARNNVSYAGLKDRHAVTRQRFSLHMPGDASPDFAAWPHPQVRILSVQRHSRKLRRGALAGNRFVLRLSSLQGDMQEAETRLQRIAAEGVPNYFGEQRFGREGDNVADARRMLAGSLRVRDRHRRSLLLSAARSQLFNAVLARRVSEGSWNRLLPGDVAMLAGSRSVFVAETVDAELLQRCADADLHPSAPLWGRGGLHAVADAAALENEVLGSEAELREGLEQAGLEAQRRPLRMMVAGLRWSLDEPHSMLVSFELPAGSYATVVLRELMAVDPA